MVEIYVHEILYSIPLQCFCVSEESSVKFPLNHVSIEHYIQLTDVYLETFINHTDSHCFTNPLYNK